MVHFLIILFVSVVAYSAMIYTVCYILAFNRHEDEEMDRQANHDFTSAPRFDRRRKK